MGPAVWEIARKLWDWSTCRSDIIYMRILKRPLLLDSRNGTSRPSSQSTVFRESIVWVTLTEFGSFLDRDGLKWNKHGKFARRNKTCLRFGVHIAAVLGRATPCILVDRIKVWINSSTGNAVQSICSDQMSITIKLHSIISQNT